MTGQPPHRRTVRRRRWGRRRRQKAISMRVGWVPQSRRRGYRGPVRRAVHRRSRRIRHTLAPVGARVAPVTDRGRALASRLTESRAAIAGTFAAVLAVAMVLLSLGPGVPDAGVEQPDAAGSIRPTGVELDLSGAAGRAFLAQLAGEAPGIPGDEMTCFADALAETFAPLTLNRIRESVHAAGLEAQSPDRIAGLLRGAEDCVAVEPVLATQLRGAGRTPGLADCAAEHASADIGFAILVHRHLAGGSAAYDAVVERAEAACADA